MEVCQLVKGTVHSWEIRNGLFYFSPCGCDKCHDRKQLWEANDLFQFPNSGLSPSLREAKVETWQAYSQVHTFSRTKASLDNPKPQEVWKLMLASWLAGYTQRPPCKGISVKEHPGQCPIICHRSIGSRNPSTMTSPLMPSRSSHILCQSYAVHGSVITFRDFLSKSKLLFYLIWLISTYIMRKRLEMF